MIEPTAFTSLDKISRGYKILEAEGKKVRREYENQHLQSTTKDDPSWPSTSQDDTSPTADKGETSHDEFTIPGPPTTAKRKTGSFTCSYHKTFSSVETLCQFQ
jgi:hypothetical protein